MMQALLELDRDFFVLVNRDLGNAFFDLIMPWLREPRFWIPVYVVLLVLFIRRHRLKSLVWITGILLTIGMSDYLASGVLKPLVKRPRPCHEAEMQAELILRKKTGCGGAYGFASSHASNHFAISAFCIVALGLRRKGWAVLLYGWAVLVSFAQIYVGVHYPGDVLAGALIGLLSAGIILRLIRYLPGRYTS